MRLRRLAFISAGFCRSTLVIEEMIASWRGTTLSSRPAAASCFFILPTPGIMPRMPDMPPIFCIWRSWSARSSRSNSPFFILRGGGLRLLRVDVLGRALDEADDVAHAEDAVGDAAGMEILQRVHLLAGADQLDRPAGDGAHGERRAAAPVAVDARQHDAGDADALVEGARDVDRVLAGQRVGDEQDLVRQRSPRSISAISSISGSSTWVRPAVSSITTS